MQKLTVVVAAFGVTLGAWAVDYTLAEGASDTMPEGTNVFDKVTVKGDLTIPARSVVRTGGGAKKTYFTGGSVLVCGEGSYFGAANYDASSGSNCQINFGQRGSDGRYGSLTVGAGGTIGLGAVSLNATSSQNPPLGTSRLEFLTVRDGGMFHVRSMSNSSKLPAQITLAGAKASFGTSTSYYSTRMDGGPFVYRLQDHVDFAYNINYGSWNASNTVVTTEGEGDLTLINNVCKADKYMPICFNPGARFDHNGALAFSRSASGSNWGEFSVFTSDVFGPNLTGLFVRQRNGVNAYLHLRFAENVTNELKTIESDYKDNTINVYGAGTLRIGADTGTSRMDVDGFADGCTTEVEKIGENELTLSKTPSIPTLRLTAGKTRFAADCTVGNLALNGGTFVINDDVVVCFDNGLSELTGKVEKGDGTVWAEGEHVICYFKGTNPDFSALTADVGFRDAFAFSATSVEDGAYAGYKQLVLTVTSRVKTIRITESGEVDLKALMGDDALTKPWSVEIAAGVTATNTTAFEGLGVEVTGGGCLAIATPSPEFTGGIYIGNAILVILCAAENPLGTGQVIIQGVKSASGGTDMAAVSQLRFALDDSTPCRLANDILIESAYSVKIEGDTISCSQVAFTKLPVGTVDFDGNLVSKGGMSVGCLEEVKSASAELICFNGTVDIAGVFVSTMRCGIGFRNRLTTSGELYASGAAGSPASVPYIYLYSDENRIEHLQTRINGSFVCMETNVLGGGYMYFADCRSDGGLMLKTFDQRLSYVYTQYDQLSKRALISADATAGAVLTLTGTVAGVSAVCKYTPLQGKLSVVMDQCGEAACTQTFKGGAHTTTGSITVRKGTLAFADNTEQATTLDKVPAVTVEGGELKLTTATAAALASVTNLTISGGMFTLDGTGANAFGERSKAIASISGDGKLALADGLEANVKCLLVDGQFVDAGRYTGEGGPSDATVIPQLTGTGVLTVRQSGLGVCILLR